jgi:dihydrodipicolinate synthase/N-acetylneuraminate lyase
VNTKEEIKRITDLHEAYNSKNIAEKQTAHDKLYKVYTTYGTVDPNMIKEILETRNNEQTPQQEREADKNREPDVEKRSEDKE